jgi:transcriptional regulator with XRE-family HTH domain
MNTTESLESIFEQQEQSIGFWEEMAIIEFTEAVLEQLELQNMSKADLAEKMNVSPAYIARLLGGSNNLTLRTMVRIARALGCEFGCYLQPDSLHGDGDQ